MAFKEVIICEKQTQKDIFVKLFNLKNVKKIDGFGVCFYDSLDGMCVTHQSGHLLELAPPEKYNPSLLKENDGWNLAALPVIPELGKWKYYPIFQKRARALLKGIKFALVENGSPGEITIAVDNDKEGELLGWEVLAYYKKDNHPNISRMLYSELTLKAVGAAYKSKTPGSQWYNRYQAGLARSYMDWLIGMNVTMAMTVVNKANLPQFYPLNSGRVIFAMIYIIAQRHEEILKFKPLEYFGEKISFQYSGSAKFTGSVEYPSKYLHPEHKKLVDKEMANKIHNHILKVQDGTVVSYDKSEKKTSAPTGFDRTLLDRHMIKVHGFSMDETDKAIQALYSEHGLATYPRVEVKHLDLSMHSEMPSYLLSMSQNLANAPQLDEKEKALYARAYRAADANKQSNIWKKGIAAGESHHAIIPTDQRFDLGRLSIQEFTVYKELCDRLIIQFLPDYQYASTQVIINVNGVKVKVSGTTPLKMGWKGLSKDPEEDADEDGAGSTVPLMNPGDKVNVVGSETVSTTTTCPKHYTEDELLKDLENPNRFVVNKELLKRIKSLQIGTGGTRKNHISQLPAKEFIKYQEEKKGRKKIRRLIPTEKLLKLNSIAPDYFRLPETSAYWEDSFNEIQAGKLSLVDFMNRQTKFLNRFFSELNNGGFRLNSPVTSVYIKCPDPCGGNTFLSILKKKKFNLWCCSKCGAAYIDENGAHGVKLGSNTSGNKGAAPKRDPNETHHACPKCKKGKAFFKAVEGKPFDLWVCDGCSATFFNQNGSLGKALSAKKK